MSEGADRPVGERRRRREAERAAAREAEASGPARPLTRRELRWQQAEEAARLEAIATGELPLAELQQAAREAAAREAAGQDAAVPTEARSTASSAAEASSADPAPSAASSLVSTVRAEGQVPSRRSLRERAQDAPDAAAEAPQERTATGRRPVIRTPSTARGVRSLDATGELSGILPVVRPDGPQEQPRRAAGPDEPVVSVAEHDTFSVQLEGSGHVEAAAPAGAVTAPGDEGDPEYLPELRPQWVAISSISGATPDEAKVSLPTPRSVRERQPAGASEARTQDDPGRHNPAVTVVKVLVLAIVAAVIGALIWLLANEARDAPADTAHIITLITTQIPEETSAR